MNEFKISALRQFGSENVSITNTVHSDNMVLSEKEVDEQIKQINYAINKAFLAVCDRELEEKKVIMAQSEKREKANKELQARIEQEMKSADRLSTSGSKLEKQAKK